MGRAWVPEAKEVQDTTVCWQGDSYSISGRKRRYYIGLLPKRSTITGVYYANLLDQLRTAISEKRRGKLSKGVLLQQDNARVHICKVAMDAVERNGYEISSFRAFQVNAVPKWRPNRQTYDFVVMTYESVFLTKDTGSHTRFAD